ncbi:MAG: hypothetical protein WAW02_14440 [Sideroxyarcus sp.]
MTDEKISKVETIAKSVERISDSRGLGEIGKGLGAGLVAFAVAFAVVGMFTATGAASKWDGHLHSQEKCFQLQEISGKIFKVNTCTGEVVPFDPKVGGENK